MASLIRGATSGSAYDPQINPYHATDCAVCLEDFTSTTRFGCLRKDPQVIALACHHVFHATCALQSIGINVDANNRFECPSCRDQVVINQDRARLALTYHQQSQCRKIFDQFVGGKAHQAAIEGAYLVGQPDVAKILLEEQRDIRLRVAGAASSFLISISIGYIFPSSISICYGNGCFR